MKKEDEGLRRERMRQIEGDFVEKYIEAHGRDLEHKCQCGRTGGQHWGNCPLAEWMIHKQAIDGRWQAGA